MTDVNVDRLWMVIWKCENLQNTYRMQKYVKHLSVEYLEQTEFSIP